MQVLVLHLFSPPLKIEVEISSAEAKTTFRSIAREMSTGILMIFR